MFHVERTLAGLINKGMLGLLLLFFICSSCMGTRRTIQITDYILVPNGKDVIGNKNLTAFIFENNLKKLPIEQYLAAKYKINNYQDSEFWVTIDKDRYKIIVYDYSEFEKYFGSANYSAKSEEPDNAKTEEKRKFIAVSMINSYNEDCLSDRSIFQNIAVNYLKDLKDEYYKQ